MNASSPARAGAWASKLWRWACSWSASEFATTSSLRREVGVERAVGRACVGHQGRHAGAVDAVLLEAPSGRFEDALSGGLLVVLAVAHSDLVVELLSIVSWDLVRRARTSVHRGRWRPFRLGPIVLRPYYDIMIVIQRSREGVAHG